LKDAESRRNARSPNAQYLRKLFVREQQFVLCYVVVNGKERPSTTLIKRMQEVAGGKLERGRQTRSGVQANGSAQAIISVDESEKRLAGNAPSLSRDLDSAKRFRGPNAEENR
jgi:hypothetical protein